MPWSEAEGLSGWRVKPTGNLAGVKGLVDEADPGLCSSFVSDTETSKGSLVLEETMESSRGLLLSPSITY